MHQMKRMRASDRRQPVDDARRWDHTLLNIVRWVRHVPRVTVLSVSALPLFNCRSLLFFPRDKQVFFPFVVDGL
jgi:hypothetical protein